MTWKCHEVIKVHANKCIFYFIFAVMVNKNLSLVLCLFYLNYLVKSISINNASTLG